MQMFLRNRLLLAPERFVAGVVSPALRKPQVIIQPQCHRIPPQQEQVNRWGREKEGPIGQEFHSKMHR